jgi:ketosteroid isomerase-like protein
MEELYWKDVQDANATHYMTLWHEDFLGWPSFSPHPIGKDGIADSTAGWFAGFVSYEFLEKSVRVTGDIGITQYAVRITRSASDGKLATNITRITHTWLKTKNTWQILGGMSAVISSSAPPASSAAAPPFAPDAPASPLTAALIPANILVATRSAAATSASRATACSVFLPSEAGLCLSCFHSLPFPCPLRNSSPSLSLFLSTFNF